MQMKQSQADSISQCVAQIEEATMKNTPGCITLDPPKCDAVCCQQGQDCLDRSSYNLCTLPAGRKKRA